MDTPQDDIQERDLSGKANEDLTAEEKRELARRFKEFQQLVREKGPRSLGLKTRRGRPAGDKRTVKKWDPAALAAKSPAAATGAKGTATGTKETAAGKGLAAGQARTRRTVKPQTGKASPGKPRRGRS